MKRVVLFICLWHVAISAISQSCTGSVGDPIVNETFGQGTSRGQGPALPDSTANLQYVNSSCPEDGQYTITNYTSTCFHGWNTVTDHTGNPFGYFMLINASYQPSVFFVQTVNGLCQGTTYQFSSWIVNMDNIPKEIMANITFTIEKTDGTVLQTYATGDIPEAVPSKWVQYGFYFTTPPGISTVVLRMRNNAPGGDGNDLGLDDIIFRPVGPLTSVGVNGILVSPATACAQGFQLYSEAQSCYSNPAYQWQGSTNGTTWTDIDGATTETFNMPVLPQGNYLFRQTIAQQGNSGIASCRVNSTVLSVQLETPAQTVGNRSFCPDSSSMIGVGPDFASCLWNNGATGDSIKVDTPGVYTALATDVHGCRAFDTFWVAPYLLPVPAFGSNLLICKGESRTLDAGAGYISYLWNDGSSTESTTIDSVGTYLVTLVDRNQCRFIDTALVTTVVDPPADFLPSDTAKCHLDYMTLGGAASYPSYSWSTGSTEPSIQISDPGMYALQVSDNNGCTGSDTITVRDSLCKRAIVLPGGFTPNGDGVNDVFKPTVWDNPAQYSLSVFDRWGHRIFETGNVSTGWDGTLDNRPAPAGTYVWMISYQFSGAAPGSENGTVVLIR